MAFYICENCGFGSAGWIGKCPDCGQFNTLKQQKDDSPAKRKDEAVKKITITPLNKIKPIDTNRLKTGIFEFDRVLGGGVIRGEAILLTGEPGIGKSTLLLQALKDLRTLYISGEESAEQVADRAFRLSINLAQFSFSSDLQVEGIVKALQEYKNDIDIVVVDSIQTIYSKDVETAAGTVSQLKETAARLIVTAKELSIPIIMVGHITKDGDIAGPKMLEHMVDAVLTFEGERVSQFRVLRAQKNRFGSTDEIGIFQMTKKGLEEVNNPLAFLQPDEAPSPGKAIVGVIEGKRPLFFEIQTLVSPTTFPVPRRVVKGVDYNKVQLLLAVIRKNIGLPLEKYDVYVNVVGGVDIKSPSADLGIVTSIISSIQNIVLNNQTLCVGEVGLLGEVRKIVGEDKIINEAKRLKFTTIISAYTIKSIRELKKFLHHE